MSLSIDESKKDELESVPDCAALRYDVPALYKMSDFISAKTESGDRIESKNMAAFSGSPLS